jgi:hypothetical protein
MRQKQYKVYLNQSEPDENHNYTSKFIGKAKGNIESGATVISNSTGGNGNLIGYIAPQKTGIFNLNGDILTKPTGEKMQFQHNTGSHDLSFLSSMVEYILKSPLSDVSGKTFEGVEGNRGYLLSFQHNGECKKVTITNNDATDFAEKVGTTAAAKTTAGLAVDGAPAVVNEGIGTAVGIVADLFF